MIDHLSFSGMSTWRQCAKKGWLHYVEGLPGDPPNEATLRGTIVHAAVEALFPVGPVRKPTLADIHYHLGVELDAADKTPITSDPSEFYETCRASLRSAVDRLSGLDEILAVELEVTHDFGEGVPFVGKVDLIARKGEQVFVIDLKTGKAPDPDSRFYWDDMEKKMVQPALYAIATRDWLGRLADRWGLLFCPHDGPSVLILPEKPLLSLADAVEAFSQTALAIQGLVAAGETPPAEPGALCGWCPYVDRCPSGEAVVRERWRLNKSVGPAREALGL